MNLSLLSHNSSQNATFHRILTFWQRLGLKARKNSNAEHLEYSLSIPGHETVGRVFQVDDWLAVQFYSPISAISPKLKGSSIQPKVYEPLKIEKLYGLLLMQFLGLPPIRIRVKADGYIIFTGNTVELNDKGGQN